MRKSALVTVSVILVSVIIIGAYALNRKTDDSSKTQEKNVSKTLSVKGEGNQNKNEEHSNRNEAAEEDIKIAVLKEQELKKQAEKQVVKEAAPKTAEKTTPKKSDPVAKTSSGKVIVIDPGHAKGSNLEKEQQAPGSSIYKIKDGGGAEGISTRIPEYRVNMLVAMKLKQNLEAMGFAVVMTKTDDSVSLGNIDRANIGNESHAALVIRIHADSSDSSASKGASMLVPAPINENTKAIYSESKRCGGVVLNTLTNQIGMQNRGVVERDDMTGFNWSKVPVILVEMGFLSNPDEDRILSTSDYQTKLARALADGIGVAIK